MKLNINEEQAIYEFLNDLYLKTNQNEKNEKRLFENYKITKDELLELVSMGNQINYDEINKIKTLFENILTFISKSSLDIVSISSHNITVSDFINISKKIGINENLIDKTLRR